MASWKPVLLLALSFSVLAAAAPKEEGTSVLTSRERDQREGYQAQTVGAIDVQYVPIAYKNYDYLEGQKPGRTGTGVHLAYEFLPFDNRYGKIGIGVGMGFYFIPSAGLGGGRDANLSVFPVEASLSYRLDYVRNQILVPFGKIGTSLAFVNQSSKTGAGREGVQTYTGFDYGAGVELCLNMLEPSAAASMERSIGIRQTFVIFEYLKSEPLGARRAPDLSHEELRIGLRFEI